MNPESIRRRKMAVAALARQAAMRRGRPGIGDGTPSGPRLPGAPGPGAGWARDRVPTRATYEPGRLAPPWQPPKGASYDNGIWSTVYGRPFATAESELVSSPMRPLNPRRIRGM
jgi:hypothetical protein